MEKSKMGEADRLGFFLMSCKGALVAVAGIVVCTATALAQKPFSEGTIVYHVELSTADNAVYKGTYTFLFKNGRVRKELKLDNGYCDVTLLNANDNTIYTLQERDGKKFAIQLSMENDVLKKQQRFKGYNISGEVRRPEPLAGQAVYSGRLMYQDSSSCEVYYCKDWKPEVPFTWNRFPDAQFIPLQFSYKEDNGIKMLFVADKMEANPVLTSVFSIPLDYKMISNEEYRRLSK